MHLILKKTDDLQRLLFAMAPLYYSKEPVTAELMLRVQDGCLTLMAGGPANWSSYDLIPDDVLSDGSCLVRGEHLLTAVKQMTLLKGEFLTVKTEEQFLVLSAGERATVAVAATPVPSTHHIPRPRSVVAFRVYSDVLRGALVHLSQARSNAVSVPSRLLGMHWKVEGSRLVLTSCSNHVMARATVPIARGEAAALRRFEEGMTVLPAGIGLVSRLAKVAETLSVPDLVFPEPGSHTVVARMLGGSHGCVGANTNPEPWPEGLPDMADGPSDGPEEGRWSVRVRELMRGLDHVLALASETRPDMRLVTLEGVHDRLRLSTASTMGAGFWSRAAIPVCTRRTETFPRIGVNGGALHEAATAFGVESEVYLSVRARNLVITDQIGLRRVLLSGLRWANDDAEPWKVWLGAKL